MRQSDCTRALLRTFDRATLEDVKSGLDWYQRAGDIAGELAAEHGVSRDDAAAVIAILSPRNMWRDNIADAHTLLEWWSAEDSDPYNPPRPINALGANVSKALRYLNGDTDALRGPKVTAFAANIRGDESFVTVDVWATRAATNGKRATPGKWFDIIANAYRSAAARVGLTPAAFQAVIWTVTRGSAV